MHIVTICSEDPAVAAFLDEAGRCSLDYQRLADEYRDSVAIARSWKQLVAHLEQIGAYLETARDTGDPALDIPKHWSIDLQLRSLVLNLYGEMMSIEA